MFSVSTADASCSPTSFAPLQVAGRTWAHFGMAYATDGAGEDAERMWIAGGSVDGSLGGLGQIDPVTLLVSSVGAIQGTAEFRPEMMGASDGTIWGFFPGIATAFVQRMDRNTAALLGSPNAVPGGLGANVVAWGAAHWGGKFSIFVTTTDVLGTFEFQRPDHQSRDRLVPARRAEPPVRHRRGGVVDVRSTRAVTAVALGVRVVARPCTMRGHGGLGSGVPGSPTESNSRARAGSHARVMNS